jgi:hypothetical protein
MFFLIIPGIIADPPVGLAYHRITPSFDFAIVDIANVPVVGQEA